MKNIQHLFSNQQQELLSEYLNEVTVNFEEYFTKPGNFFTTGDFLRGFEKWLISQNSKDNSLKITDTRIFVKEVAKFYENNRKMRGATSKFQSVILSSLGFDWHVMDTGSVEDLHKISKLTLKEVNEEIEKKGGIHFLNKVNGFGPNTKKAYLKFREELELN